MGKFKLQSAMEYLMTYGWAILIIAVVLGALFGLGFFNSGFLTPKVGPGACQIYRPYGPGTSAHATAQGTCTNGEPQAVAQFSPLTNGNVLVTGMPVSSEWTVMFWMFPRNPPGLTSSTPAGVFSFGSASDYIGFSSSSTFGVNGATGVSSTQSLYNTWSFVAVTYNGVSTAVYVDGAQTNGNAGSITPNSIIYIGSIDGAGGDSFNGLISNVQYYNASLAPAEITAMYHSGIGVVPQLANNLVGWWQLNSNANDYSGNQQSGVSTAVVYTNSWESGYTAP